jgi:hypothetical protein
MAEAEAAWTSPSSTETHPLAEAADSDLLRQAMEDIMSALGAVTDRSGKPRRPIRRGRLQRPGPGLPGLAEATETEKDLVPLGPEPTAAAAAALDEVEAR